ncbi:MAG TPA: glycosyltransferase family 1 protein [Rhodobiaceae bacterium]|jgi:glycosyltransferase involved in cell wall biosynthesis|nr:glycosyltransferase family 1 protein [Rhodobiaceae bacterium]
MNRPEKISGAAPQRIAEIKDGAPLRILLPSYRSDPHTGGQGIYMRLISKALVDLGHHVDVISGPPYPELDPRIGLIKLPSLDMYARENPITCLNREIIGNKTDLFEWWSHNWGGFPEPYTFGVRMAEYMRDKIDQYDIMHDNQTLCYGMLDVRDMGLPVVGTIHHPITKDRRIDIKHAKWPWIKFLKWRWYSFLNMQINVARALDPLIVVSDSTKRDVHKDFKIPMARMVRIHHGIDHELFTPQPHITRRKNRLMATASADVPLKGLIYLIRAYHMLLVDHPDLELTVVGRLREGQTMDELNRLGIRDRVKFISGLSGEQIRDLYAEATIAVSPSVYEGFGFPAGEALSCGVPLVATDGGSLPEVVGDAGIIVPHSNPPALARAIDALLRDENHRAELSIKARQHILENFKWERCARDVVQLYRQTIAAQKAA